MSNGQSQAGTVETEVPARLDRLPWSRFHWMVVIGLCQRDLPDGGVRRARRGGAPGTEPRHRPHEYGRASRRELRRRVGARYWGPGRFGEALREAVAQGRAKQLPKGQFAPTTGDR